MHNTTIETRTRTVVKQVNDEEVLLGQILDLYPAGIVSVVMDTFDLWHALTHVLPFHKEKIMARDGKLVIRPDCYDDDTSILTPRGWVPFPELQENDKVAQVHPDGTYDFVEPLKRTRMEYNGYMVSFKDSVGKADLLVTPNHRMLWKRRKGNSVVEAGMSNVGSIESKMYRSASAKSKGKSLSSLERLKIAFQADGSYPSKVSETTISGLRTYRFNFAKSRKIERLVSICESGGFNFSVHEEDARQGQKTIYVKLPENEEMLKDFSWVDTSDLCGDWSKEFIEELSYWDATRRSDTRYKFDTVVKEVSEVVELIALSAGYGVLVSHREDAREERYSDIHTLHIMTENLVGGQSITKEYVWYTGMIHCVTVPTGMLFVKRNRATAVSGNSGDPVDILTGKNSRTLKSIHSGTKTDPEDKGVVELLWETFGGTVNDKGFKELDSHIGVIYGDSINYERAQQIIARLEAKGFASTNVVFGVGSFTYQYNTRDTFMSAIKATWAEIDGKGVNLKKDPATDSGTKKSATGRLAVLREENGDLFLAQEAPPILEDMSVIQPIWENGKFIHRQTFEDVRNVLNS